MTAEQVKTIFEPVIKQVVELVDGQVNAIREKKGRVSGIILVGGFGQSNYLYTRLRQHFNSAPPPPYSEQAYARDCCGFAAECRGAATSTRLDCGC